MEHRKCSATLKSKRILVVYFKFNTIYLEINSTNEINNPQT